MSINDYSNQLVKLTYRPSGDRGTGVILSSESNPSCFFIITARHNFGSQTNPAAILIDSLQIKHYKGNEELEVESEELVAFFFKDDNHELHDIALLILNVKEPKHLQKVKQLKIYDSDQDRGYSNDHKSFELVGYRGNESNYHHKSRNVEVRISRSKDDDPIEELKDAGSITAHAIPDSLNYYKSVSGGGVFYEDMHGTTQLRSIVLQYHDGFFSCFKLDFLAQEINQKILGYEQSLSELEIGSFLLSGKHSIDINKITDFNEFKRDIVENIPANELINDFEIPHNFEMSPLDKPSMMKLASQLREKKKELKKQNDDLSYIFALLALHAHKNSERWLTTKYFRDAIELNGKHEQTLMLERADRKDQIRVIKAITSAEVKAKYDKLLDQFSEKDLLGRRNIIKEAIDEASQIYDRNQSGVIDYFKSKLVVNYENDDSMRHFYKYQELGDYLHATRSISDEPCLLAFENHTLALQVAKLSPKISSTFIFLGENSISYGARYATEFQNNQGAIKERTQVKAEKITRREEDPETTQMIRQIYSDIGNLRKDSSGNLNQIEHSRKELSLIRLNSEEQRHLLHEGAMELPDIKKGITKVSSQLYRTEHHALAIAKDLASKIPVNSREVRKKSSHRWIAVFLIFGFAVFIASIITKALISLGLTDHESMRELFSSSVNLIKSWASGG